jgi:hypothetical protein
MDRTEIWAVNIGRFSLSIARYGDGSGVHVRRMSFGPLAAPWWKRICTRWAFDVGLYRLRVEWY